MLSQSLQWINSWQRIFAFLLRRLFRFPGNPLLPRDNKLIRLEAVWQVRLVEASAGLGRSPHKNWVRSGKRQRAPAVRRKVVTEKAAASCSFGLLSCSKSPTGYGRR